MDEWLRAGGTHHMVMNLGHRGADWAVFCAQSGIEYRAV
jgi:L-arabinose isomerase